MISYFPKGAVRKFLLQKHLSLMNFPGKKKKIQTSSQIKSEMFNFCSISFNKHTDKMKGEEYVTNE